MWVPHQIVVTAAFVKSWWWFVESERCFFIFFLCLRDPGLPLLLPMRPLQLCGSCLFEEGICPQSLVWCCFLLTQKKSRFNGQKCEDMTVIGVVGNTKPKRLSTMYWKDDCDSKGDKEMWHSVPWTESVQHAVNKTLNYVLSDDNKKKYWTGISLAEHCLFCALNKAGVLWKNNNFYCK